MILPDFPIEARAPMSAEFRQRSQHRFRDAAQFIRCLPYRRNTDKTDLHSVFADHCGTCSTKHAVLGLLTLENNVSDMQLCVGIFRMHAGNTPLVAATLFRHKLDFIPEAHCYLVYGKQRLDFTKEGSRSSDFENELLTETVMAPLEIAAHKVPYHRNYLSQWLNDNPQIRFSLEELWAIREKCIRDLSV